MSDVIKAKKIITGGVASNRPEQMYATLFYDASLKGVTEHTALIFANRDNINGRLTDDVSTNTSSSASSTECYDRMIIRNLVSYRGR